MKETRRIVRVRIERNGVLCFMPSGKRQIYKYPQENHYVSETFNKVRKGLK